MTLDRLPVGRQAVILSTGGRESFRRRLLDMGLTPGTEVMIRRVAPFGDPVELLLRGYALSLRLEDVRNIQVREVPA